MSGKRSKKVQIQKDIYMEQEDQKNLPLSKVGVEQLRLINKLKYKNDNQKLACEVIDNNVLTFLGGPAGSAKSFLAVAKAVAALKEGKVRKIYLSRPVVEAGTTLGFLPGGLNDKLEPYIRPIYDCLEYFVGSEGVAKLIESKIIEVVPITMMRGRTLSDAFIILDEMQNASKEQLKLALTRIGFGSQCCVTYDFAQCDISKSVSCVNDILNFEGAKDVGFFKFKNEDICRAEIVKTVLEVYKQHEEDSKN